MANTEWIDNIKQIVKQAEKASDPCDIIQGKVETANPLSVRIDQKLVLTQERLMVPEHLTNHAVPMNIPGIGTVSVVVENGLKVGNNLLLIQKRGGQQYAIMDRW